MDVRSIAVGVGVAIAAVACNIHDVEEADARNGTLDTATGTGATSAVGGSGAGAEGGGYGAQGGDASGGMGAGAGGFPPMGASIDCDGVPCDPMTEKCCSGMGCFPLAAACSRMGLGVDDLFYEMTCDDDTDCPAGETCCVEPHEDVAAGLSYVCKSTTCGLHPSCAPGDVCAGGLECADDPTEASGAKCVDPTASVGCGGATFCEGVTPVCCFLQGAGSCLGYGECGGGSSAYECDDAADCGTGYSCCADAAVTGSECGGTCKSVVLCADDADCAMGTCKQLVGGIGPPSFKSCQ